jgi:hypothetical protein
MEVVAPGKAGVLPAVPHVLAVVDAPRVVDPVSLEAVDDVVLARRTADSPPYG